MKYKRQEVFTIAKVLNQVVNYVRKNKELPKTIYLPPEEYVFLPYLLPPKHLEQGARKLIGIPVEVCFEIQSKDFMY